MPNSVRSAVCSECALAYEASFLDHVSRGGVRDVSLGLDSLKPALSNRPASDQPQSGRTYTLSASLRKHGDSDGARAVGDHPERHQSNREITRSVRDHERRPLPLGPALAGIAEVSSASAQRHRLIFKPPLRLRIMTRRTDKRLVLGLAETQHDLAVGRRTIRKLQLDPTTLTDTPSQATLTGSGVIRDHWRRRAITP